MDLTDEEKEYITKYEEKYGKLDEEGKKHVLKYRNSLNEEELDKMLEEWVGKNKENFIKEEGKDIIKK